MKEALKLESKNNTEKEHYLNSLKEITLFLDEKRIEYRLVGSTAIYYWIYNGDMSKYRFTYRDGSVRDIDIVIFGPLSEEDQKDINRKIKGIYERYGVDIQVTDNVVYKYIHNGQSRFYLKYRDVMVSVPKEVWQIKKVHINGIEIKSLPPETLFHLFVVLGGILRKKDIYKIYPLARYIKSRQSEGLPESYYEGFHEFIKERNNRYKVLGLSYRIRKELSFRNLNNYSSFVLKIMRYVKNICCWIEECLKAK